MIKTKNQKIFDELLSTQQPTKADVVKKPKELEPITKKQLIKKLIPFMIVSFLLLVGFILAIVFASITNVKQSVKNVVYYGLPILLVILSPFLFYMFDKQFTKYNLKHNEKMKHFLGKLFVKSYSQNGCFRLKDIYWNNPLQYAWDLKPEQIIDKYKVWNPKAYENDVKYYKEL